MRNFVKLLLESSEKAGNIARIVRSESKLFSLLIQGKGEIEKNHGFMPDFKTLADVLIQESLRFEINSQFPEMGDRIYGEESNSFTNVLGENIILKIEENPGKTKALLHKILDGNEIAAQLLTNEVHRKIDLNSDDLLSTMPIEIENSPSFSELGIWIDPIDGTSEYIKGSVEDYENKTLYTHGLHCVTILIGAFRLTDGIPVVGVVNQPFCILDKASNSWQGRSFWGVSVNGNNYSSINLNPSNSTTSISTTTTTDTIPDTTTTTTTSTNEIIEEKKTIILTFSEDSDLKERLSSKFNLLYSSGAGYKILCVGLGLAHFYLCSMPSTHYWDTNSPHAILSSLGGDIMDYQRFVNEMGRNDLETSDSAEIAVRKFSIRYPIDNDGASGDNKNYSNLGGIIALRDSQDARYLKLLLECIDSNSSSKSRIIKTSH